MSRYSFKDYIWETEIQGHVIRGVICSSLSDFTEKSHSSLEARMAKTVAQQLINMCLYKSGPDEDGKYQAVPPEDIKLIDILQAHTFPILPIPEEEKIESPFDRRARKRKANTKQKVSRHQEKLEAKKQGEPPTTTDAVEILRRRMYKDKPERQASLEQARLDDKVARENLKKKRQVDPNRVSKEKAQELIFEHFSTGTRRMTEAAKTLNVPYARIRVILFKMAEEGYNNKTLKLNKTEVDGNVAFNLTVT